MKKKKSLKDKKKDHLSALCNKACDCIQKSGLKEFPRSWLVTSLGISDREAAQVASQLKKDLVLFGENNLDTDDGVARYRVRS